MLVQLNKDPLFVVTQSPLKAIKQKEIQRKKLMRQRRNNPERKKRDLDIQIIDPLQLELKNYRTETTYKSSVQTSKASESLKKYVIEQQRNLRCLRLDKITSEQKINTSRLKSLTLNLTQIEEDEKTSKEIHIPRVEDLFRNQSKEILIYQNTTLRGRLGRMIQNLDQGINKFKQMTFSQTKEEDTSGVQTARVTLISEGEDQDTLMQKSLQRSNDLRQKLYNEKREMIGRSPGQTKKANSANNMSYFLREVEKPKRREALEGVRVYPYKDGNRNLKLTAASILLFQMNKLSNQKNKKQYQLNGLLKNSFQNRDNILKQKEVFYESQNPFNDLSPSKQFQLRKVMNKKLNHRLEISKEQVNKFVAYLYEIKNYHVVLNDTVLQIMKEVRETLLRGKVMKSSDLQKIIERKSQGDLVGYPNELIVKTLTEMMI